MTTRRRRTRSSGEDQEHNSTSVTFSSSRNAENSALDMTSCRERTPEFLSAVKSIKTRQVGGYSCRKVLNHFHRREDYVDEIFHSRNDFLSPLCIKNIFHALKQTLAVLKNHYILRKLDLYDKSSKLKTNMSIHRRIPSYVNMKFVIPQYDRDHRLPTRNSKEWMEFTTKRANSSLLPSKYFVLFVCFEVVNK